MSSSKLPNGGYTLTSGSNYMLDGFQFDTEYNGGVLEKARLPEAKGLSTLPSGMIPLESPLNSDLPTGVEVDLDLDLGDFTRSASQDVPLVDHSWLASIPQEDLEGMRTHEEVLEQFAEGRFEHPQVNQLKTLEDAWARGSTTGLDIIPNSQRKHQKYTNPYHKNQSQLPGDDYRMRVELGQRKVAYGLKADSVISELSEGLSEGQLEKLSSELTSEYGLNGRVYIKESHFPGLFNGRWDEVISKKCASAMYIISEKEDCAFDRFLGKEVVASVRDINWKKAYQTLMPKLEAYGVTKVSGSNYASMLKQAFVDLMDGRVNEANKSSTWYHIQPNQSDFISLDHARSELEKTSSEDIFVASVEEVEETKISSKLARIASQLISQGFLESEQVEAIVSCDKAASEKINRLYELASQPVAPSSYEGQGRVASYHNMHKARVDAEAYVPEKGSRELARRNKVAQQKVAELISANLVTLEEVQKVAKGATPELKVKSVIDYIQTKTEKVSSYQGAVDNFEARLSIEQLTKIQSSFFDKQASSSREAYEKEVMSQIDGLIKSGVLSMSQFEGVMSKHASLDARLHAIYQLVSKPVQVKKASGQTGHYGAQFSKKAEISYSASDWSKAQSKVSKLVETGLLSQEQVESISSSANPDVFVRKAFDLASKPSEVAEYQGESTAHILNGSKKSVQSQTEMKVATWVRQKMSEGSAGQELDALLAGRFSQSVLEEHKASISSLRVAHEGISGHAYVDAEAYMTTGTEGCEKGSLIHRANQIPTLLKSAKCGSCVFNSGGSCQKYAKVIVASADDVVADRAGYQSEMIRLANASDSEQTASLFVNNYDEGEFGLTHNASVDISDAPDNEVLGDVLFGGFNV